MLFYSVTGLGTLYKQNALSCVGMFTRASGNIIGNVTTKKFTCTKQYGHHETTVKIPTFNLAVTTTAAVAAKYLPQVTCPYSMLGYVMNAIARPANLRLHGFCS